MKRKCLKANKSDDPTAIGVDAGPQPGCASQFRNRVLPRAMVWGNLTCFFVMSRALLARLNGGNSGEFAEWLKNHPWEPRIAWYPSCGGDFRDVIYLHRSNVCRSFGRIPEPPEIFIHTDCSIGFDEPFNQLRTRHHKFVYRDEWTTVSVVHEEELPELDVSLKACTAGYSQFGASGDYGRVFFLLLHIESDRLGSILQPVVYAIVENGAFASQVLLEAEARITHIWNVLPGGRPNPWIGYLLRRLTTESLIRENNFYCEDELAYQRREYFECFPNLEGGAEDFPDSSRWHLLRTLAPKSEAGGFKYYALNLTKSESEKKILDFLYEKSVGWKWLQSNAGACFSSSSFSSHGIYKIFFRLGTVEDNLMKNLFPERLEVSRKVAEVFSRASGDTYFDRYQLRNLSDCLTWDQSRHFEVCTFSKYYHPNWILRLFWTENGIKYIYFLKNSSHPVERDFWQMEAVFDFLMKLLGPFVEKAF
jgi:hypothetical protein